MKKLISNYTFDASAKTITFTDYATIALRRVLLVTNTTDQIIIYNFADTTKGGTAATNVLTLEHDTTSMDDADLLQIFYEEDVVGTDDSALPATPPILTVGGEYRTSPVTYTDGDAAIAQADVNGFTRVTLATKVAGEDLTNDVMKTEQQFTNIFTSVASGSTVAKTGAGLWHNITFGNVSCPTLVVYDNTANSGSILQTFIAGYPVGTYAINATLTTGLTLFFSGGVNPQVSVRVR